MGEEEVRRARESLDATMSATMNATMNTTMNATKAAEELRRGKILHAALASYFHFVEMRRELRGEVQTGVDPRFYPSDNKILHQNNLLLEHTPCILGPPAPHPQTCCVAADGSASEKIPISSKTWMWGGDSPA